MSSVVVIGQLTLTRTKRAHVVWRRIREQVALKTRSRQYRPSRVSAEPFPLSSRRPKSGSRRACVSRPLSATTSRTSCVVMYRCTYPSQTLQQLQENVRALFRPHCCVRERSISLQIKQFAQVHRLLSSCNLFARSFTSRAFYTNLHVSNIFYIIYLFFCCNIRSNKSVLCIITIVKKIKNSFYPFPIR